MVAFGSDMAAFLGLRGLLGLKSVWRPTLGTDIKFRDPPIPAGSIL
jgi:hypothetical protein